MPQHRLRLKVELEIRAKPPLLTLRAWLLPLAVDDSSVTLLPSWALKPPPTRLWDATVATMLTDVPLAATRPVLFSEIVERLIVALGTCIQMPEPPLVPVNEPL